MGIEIFTNWITQQAQQTTIFGIGLAYIISLGIVFLSSLLISPKKPSNMKLTAFPLMIGFKSIGFNIPLVFLAGAGILFVMETLSLQSIGSFVRVTASAIGDTINYGTTKLERKVEKLAKQQKKRENFKELTENEIGLGFRNKLTKEQRKYIEERNRLGDTGAEGIRKSLDSTGRKIRINPKGIIPEIEDFGIRNRINITNPMKKLYKEYRDLGMSKESAFKKVTEVFNFKKGGIELDE